MNLRKTLWAAGFLVLLPLAGCDNAADDSKGVPVVQVSVERAFPALTFRRPVDLQTAPDGSNLLYVVEQDGRILAIENRDDVDRVHVFLNITDRVTRRDNEEGLLGLAFHPDYAINGIFFVYYSAESPRRSVVARYHASNGTADRASEEVLLEVPQPFGNHNAGQMQFGPDGYLYMALGDGGSGGDPHGNGQNRQTLLGSLLRIDVDRTTEQRPYAIPADNPFVGNDAGYHEEIYAYGLRNPWRFSFDRATGWLWLADVGQERYEEINIIENGGNYGWDVLEAEWCFEPLQDCDDGGISRPIWSYAHNQGSSITGGYVYQGERVPDLKGRYVYGDFSSGRIWALAYDGARATNQLLADTDISITSFGQDRDGEVYVLGFSGAIYRIVPRQ